MNTESFIDSSSVKTTETVPCPETDKLTSVCRIVACLLSEHLRTRDLHQRRS